MKILIAYATKCGSTAEIATEIGKVFMASLPDVDVTPVKSINGLVEYDAVVIGSAIRVGSWLKEAHDFVIKHQVALNSLPIFIFSVHGLNWENTASAELLRKNYTVAVRQKITPVSEAFFTGVIDYSKLTTLEKLMAKAVKATEADRRDWEAIRKWAQDSARILTEMP